MPRVSYRNRLLLKKILRIILILLAIALVVGIFALIYAEPYVVYDRDGAHLNFGADAAGAQEQTPPPTRPVVENPQIVYDEPTPETKLLAQSGGYYVTTAMLQNPSAVLEAVKAIEEPCAIMLELKSIYGNFYYSTSIAGAPTADVDIDAVDSLITYLVDHRFYVIAVLPAFSDSAFALENIPCGLPLSSGALWVDGNGCYWLDPANETVLSYLMQIARELSGMGISEVAFSGFYLPQNDSIAYTSEQTAEQIIQAAATELTDFFTQSNLMISFVTTEDSFPAAACKGRLYIPDVDATQIERYVQLYGSTAGLTELVFLANSRDTRFENRAVLRPLLTES